MNQKIVRIVNLLLFAAGALMIIAYFAVSNKETANLVWILGFIFLLSAYTFSVMARIKPQWFKNKLTGEAVEENMEN
jgi:hypothetical protein